MGIFAVFRRKTKDAVEEPAVGAPAEAPEQETGGEPAEGSAEGQAPGSAAVEPVGESGTDAPAGDASAGPAEAVEIPRQQSAAAAADNEAGEGVRK
ncbi:hypothetical protein [Streptomyces sp. NPDC054757]